MTTASETTASDVHPNPRLILAPYHDRPLVRSLATFAFDLSLFLGLSVLIIGSHILWVKLVAGVLCGMMMGRLFVIGHDACHGSFSHNKRLNRIVGTIAFLPTLTSFSAWDMGHNRTHHAYTNLSTHDYVWAPFSKSAYDALPRWRQALEQLYRTPFGQGLNYCVEIWWKHYFFRRTPTAGLRDSYLLAGVWAAATLALVIVAQATGQNVLLELLCSMVVPFAIWNTSMGFIIYQQHTSPDIRWYDTLTDWRTANFAIDDTQRVVFLRPINTVFHNIMEHHAHHFDPLISLHELPRAQKALETSLGPRIRVVPWTLRSFLNATRICKLYDYTEHRWLDFTGRYTSDRIA